ncbi:hypothetical protein LHP98_13935 [Rhodobacter sp. Har01]|uniref:hypothetical protein n=1 Tax=Rhodobacter sp. Har01 TaxID=2883999 RepID=UPI001D09447B|nr:hypothetical protein [Rhodobacter sp. Har01]MCB6179222.1 hypothetical protein [Rhodobacter sp. Har01]
MTRETKTERRWLTAVIAASSQPLPALPWARGARNPQRRAAPQPVPAPRRPAVAAR